nr:MAG TPA: baseplate wedge protein [Caudoviricetes sp.]
MDVLTNKNYNIYGYTCRYTIVPYYYNTEDKKYTYGITTNISKNTTYVAHKVKDTDTLDYLALKYYNNPTYYWVIANFNDILDPYIKLVEYFSVIKIPNISGITFEEPR